MDYAKSLNFNPLRLANTVKVLTLIYVDIAIRLNENLRLVQLL